MRKEAVLRRTVVARGVQSSSRSHGEGCLSNYCRRGGMPVPPTRANLFARVHPAPFLSTEQLSDNRAMRDHAVGAPQRCVALIHRLLNCDDCRTLFVAPMPGAVHHSATMLIHHGSTSAFEFSRSRSPYSAIGTSSPALSWQARTWLSHGPIRPL